jgi:ParB/RepB/Spo0J family partition protein
MITHVNLDQIDDNPFQARIDYGNIDELAESIRALKDTRPETSGLINPPVGRVVDENGAALIISEHNGIFKRIQNDPGVRVQLAAGHRRLRAFQHLNQEFNGYARMPVDLNMLSDREMDDIAWSENSDREDISPVEEAQSLQAAMERFGYTQTEIGQRRGLSQAAVSNKIRLLQLPEHAQTLMRNGVITERHGRALLRLSEAFPSMRSERINLIYDLLTGSRHRTNDSSDVDPVAQVTKRVKAYLDEHTRNLSAAEFAGWQPPDGLPACEGCEHRIKRGRRCKNPPCYDEKQERHTALVTGPQKARALYREHSAAEGGPGWSVQPDPPRWARCACCKRSHNDLPQEYRREWYKIENRYKYICSACWERANLTPIQPQDQNQPQEIASAPIADNAPNEDSDAPSTLNIDSPQEETPSPPPATLITARILPAANDQGRDERRVMVSIAEEGEIPKITRTGTYPKINLLIGQVLHEYFV